MERHGEDINDSFPGDNSTAIPDQLPNGSILDGVPLSTLGGTREDDKGHVIASLATVPFTSSAPFVAVALMDAASPNAISHAAFDINTPTTGTTPELPTAIVLGCGGGESIRASEDIREMLGATDHD